MDQFDELLHQRAAEESFPLPEDYAGRVFQTCAALDENSRRRQRRHWENMGRGSACAVHHNSERIPLSCGSNGGDPWAWGVGESGHLPELRLQ